MAAAQTLGQLSTRANSSFSCHPDWSVRELQGAVSAVQAGLPYDADRHVVGA